MQTLTQATELPPGADSRADSPADARGAAPPRALAAVDRLLRDPASVLERIRRGDGLAELARTLILTVLVACGAFGAAVGAYRGGVQVLYAAVKLPLVALLCAALAAPALTALNAALGRRAHLVGDLALLLAALAMGSLALAAEAPLLLLAATLHFGYHATVLLVFGCCAVAGAAALALFARGLAAAEPGRRVPVIFGVLAVLLMVGSQLAWTFRPYVVRPRTAAPPFMRPLEGSLIESVLQSWNSANGHYRFVPSLEERDAPIDTMAPTSQEAAP
jgi:hypothetical protein